MKLRFSLLRRGRASSNVKVMNIARLAALAALVANGCKDSGKAASAGNSMAKMAAFRDQMCACKDTACAKHVSAEMAAWSKAQPVDKPEAMTADEQKKATELGTQLGECLTRATSGSAAPTATPPPLPVTPPAGSGSDLGLVVTKNTQGLPEECDRYKAAIEKIGTCEHMAKAARDTLVKGYEDAAARWAALPEEAKATLSTACAGGFDAVIGVGKAQCGW